MTAVAELALSPARPWRRAALWLAFLAPFFYATYGAANWLAASRPEVGSFVFEWERRIPFVAWTIIPYWSINALYALSLFVCRDRRELDAHGRRLLTAQLIAVACFLAFPLRFSFDRPEAEGGVIGFLFDAIGAFDKPFNQAPSLHIALLVILWSLFARHVPRWAALPLHLWFVLIGVSVLTTYQHHFIDVPTGAALGLFCLWLWPHDGDGPLSAPRLADDPRRRALALRYAAAAAVLAAGAAAFGGWALILWWPAGALGLVAANYAVIGPGGFGKASDGTASLAARLLYAPYQVGALLNSRAWTRRDPLPAHVADGVWIGRLPSGREREGARFNTIVDLCAELPVRAGGPRRHALPCLDLAAPTADTLARAADLIELGRPHGPVLVCCALGYSRSAAAAAAWLLRTGRAANVDAAVAAIRRARPAVVLDEAARDAIQGATR